MNIAARIESLADAGGVCISGTAYDHMGKRLAVGYEYLGEQQVKNIEKPVKVYRVLTDFGAVQHEKEEIKLPDKPSIAVLAFTNMSDDSELEYFSDGLAEDIITALSRASNLLVIARNSSFTFKGKPVKVQQVGRELGVRHVLEGSVRKAGDKLRVTAQLVEAKTGNHVWAQRYDRDLNDIFAVQDDITKQIITALQVELTDGEDARLWTKGTSNVEAYLKFLHAAKHFYTMTKEAGVIAKRLLEEAISLDPDYSAAHAAIATLHWMTLYLGPTVSQKESMAKGIMAAEKAIELDESNALAYAVRAAFYTQEEEHDKAASECERAMILEPNSAFVHSVCGWTYRYAGLHELAIQSFSQAMRLDPIPRSWHFRGLAGCYAFLGRHEEAIAAGRKGVEVGPTDPLAHVNLAAAYSIAGHTDKARNQALEVPRIDPSFSLQRYANGNKYRKQGDKDMHIKALRKAGLE